MSRFIKLTSLIINPRNISYISMKNEKYNLFFIDHKIDGFFLFGSGGCDSTPIEIVVCKNKHPTDYAIMTEWVKGV
jgi:hypothetical protein